MGTETRSSVATTPRRPLHHQYLPWINPARESPLWAEPGLYHGEPEACRRSLGMFLRNFAYMALLLAVFKVYRIEERAFQGHTFQMLMTLALAALPIHYLTPYRYKKHVFVAISIGGLCWIFGVQVAAFVLTAARSLSGNLLPASPWIARAALVGVVALVTGLRRRSGLPRSILPDSALPILASMFMFRMIIYLYELKHAKTPETLVDTLSYFFLLPNFCFTLFPVVDYRTMQRGYFSADVHALQRRGLQMMLQGTVQLLAYRLVYHEMLIPPSKVHNLASLSCYMVSNYLLYLEVSGQFHVACGMLHLFGFQLPRTHHNYLLATGFTDYWRRINIYWKDFMVRLFFNPVVFRLKRWPQPAALAAGTVVVFVATWLLHAYQWYWLRGSWGFSVPDALFWGILGGAGARECPARRPPAPHGAAGGCQQRKPAHVRRACTAECEDRGDIHHDRRALVAMVEPQPLGLARDAAPRVPGSMRDVMSRQLIVTLVILACGLLPARLSGDRPARLRDSLRSNLMNRVDLERIERGYYEQLLDPGRRLDALADVPDMRLRGSPSGTWSVPLEDSPLVMRVDDVREVVLKPNDDTFKKGVRWRTNSLGMRDRAVRGRQTGRNVSDRACGRLDRRRLGGRRRRSVRVDPRTGLGRSLAGRRRARRRDLELRRPGAVAGQRWCHFSQVGWPMNPDMVIYQSTASDVGWDERRLRYLLARGIGWDSPVYRAVLSRSRLERLGSPDDYKRALRPRHWEILEGVYRTIIADCQAAGVPIIWVLVPRVGRSERRARPAGARRRRRSSRVSRESST